MRQMRPRTFSHASRAFKRQSTESAPNRAIPFFAAPSQPLFATSKVKYPPCSTLREVTRVSTDKPTTDGETEVGRLDSWKKIASYLKRDVTTVQRWEKREGMPVHRHVHAKSGSVYAFQAELDEWRRRRIEKQPLDVSKAESGSPEDEAGLKPQRVSSFLSAPKLVLGLTVGFAAAAVIIFLWMDRDDGLWRNPLAGAAYHTLIGFDGQNAAAAISRDGRFVAFLSDRAGSTEVWVTQISSGQFQSLTHGLEGEFINPSIRELGFSPDGSLVTFWLRQRSRPPGEDISVWATPTQGGQPKPYVQGAAEVTWSPDGNRFAYHTTLPGDPLYVTDGKVLSTKPPIMVAPSGLHSHFPVWGTADSIYFIKGNLPDQMDVWRVDPEGRTPERLTQLNSALSYPVLLDRRNLLFLAREADGSGPWIYGMDVEHRAVHRVSSGVEQFTSLGASGDGHRLIATVAVPQRSLWRLPLSSESASDGMPVRVVLGTGEGFAPRFGPGYFLYVASSGTGESIWRVSGNDTKQLWSRTDARIVGTPSVSTDGRLIAFSVKQREKTVLYSMTSEGTETKVLADSLRLEGSPAWSPDGSSVTTAADEGGVPHLFRIRTDSRTPVRLLADYSTDPLWSADGKFVIYSGPDIGTRFEVKAVSEANAQHTLPPLTLTRGARHLALLPGGRKLVFLQGEIHHKNLWSVDLESGVTSQLTNLPTNFDVRDFDMSPDGREVILERAQVNSQVVVIDRAT
jgi:Tol biopolymer transport system component